MRRLVPTGPYWNPSRAGQATTLGTLVYCSSQLLHAPASASSALWFVQSGTHTWGIEHVSEPYAPAMNEGAREATRSRELGMDKTKRKIRKMNDRKLASPWDEQDDGYNAETPMALGSERVDAGVI